MTTAWFAGGVDSGGRRSMTASATPRGLPNRTSLAPARSCPSTSPRQWSGWRSGTARGQAAESRSRPAPSERGGRSSNTQWYEETLAQLRSRPKCDRRLVWALASAIDGRYRRPVKAVTTRRASLAANAHRARMSGAPSPRLSAALSRDPAIATRPHRPRATQADHSSP